MSNLTFTPESVRAIIQGSKTQTRRVMKAQPDFIDAYGNPVAAYPCGFKTIKAPLKVGDLVWVKEPWCHFESDRESVCGISYELGPESTIYKADWLGKPEETAIKWKSPRYMPRWASRLTLRITEVRAERLQELSHVDAVAECMATGTWTKEEGPKPPTGTGSNAWWRYQRLWQKINGKKHPWESNPFVWIYTFAIEESK